MKNDKMDNQKTPPRVLKRNLISHKKRDNKEFLTLLK